jgi:hypothetical protein
MLIKANEKQTDSLPVQAPAGRHHFLHGGLKELVLWLKRTEGKTYTERTELKLLTNF